MQMSMDLEDERKYFFEALDFFSESRWIYEFPVTEILMRNCLEQFPDGWMMLLRNLNNEELNELVVNKITKRDWPESLLSFVEKILRLDKLSPINMDLVEILPKSFTTRLSKKKQHEILHLANLVNTQCKKEAIETIVDLGAGLGYVCQLLNYLYGYRVLGLESNPQNVETAKRRQKEFYASSMDRVNYVCTKIDIDSAVEINSFLKNLNQNEDDKFCLIGLHACADLGVDACKLFSKISSAKILILLSCCYHKMEISRESENEMVKEFHNFPMSETLREIVQSSDNNYRDFLQRPFLRLACQEPAIRWKNMTVILHREHAFHVLARGILEFFAHKNSITLKKLARKATRKSQCVDFSTYLHDTMLRYEFKFNDGTLPEAKKMEDRMLSMWEENSMKLTETEIYTGLQLMLQSPVESFVLQDRRCWLREMGFETEIIAVTSRILSPRSHAIVSRKNK